MEIGRNLRSGGVGYGQQLAAFKAGAHLVIGTPGRILIFARQDTRNILDGAPADPPKMRWLFGENPDIHTLGHYPPAGKRKFCIIFDLPEKNN